jgi:hypothetical protein
MGPAHSAQPAIADGVSLEGIAAGTPRGRGRCHGGLVLVTDSGIAQMPIGADGGGVGGEVP